MIDLNTTNSEVHSSLVISAAVSINLYPLVDGTGYDSFSLPILLRSATERTKVSQKITCYCIYLVHKIRNFEYISFLRQTHLNTPKPKREHSRHHRSVSQSKQYFLLFLTCTSLISHRTHLLSWSCSAMMSRMGLFAVGKQVQGFGCF